MSTDNGQDRSAVPRLTVDKKILLHLYETHHTEEDFEVPKEVVQEGMAEAISIRRDNIPRTMKRLKEEDLVDERLKRIKGLPRKRKAYFLTAKGLDYAKEVFEDIASLDVFLQVSDGSIKTLELKDVPYYLSVRIKLADLLLLMGKERVIKETAVRTFLSEGQEPLKRLSTEGFISIMQDVPLPKKFYGREKELSFIRGWLSREEGSMLSITGIAGIGKTTLAAKCATEMEGKMHILWYRFHRWDSLRNVIYSISRFLEQMGRSGLRTYLDSSPSLEGRELYSLLESSMKDLPLFMVFDDFQRASDDTVELFGNLKEMLPGLPGVKVIIVGRQVFPFYDRSDVVVNRTVHELNISGLDRESCRGLMKMRDLTDDMFERVYNITKGHPLFLQLVLSAKDLSDQKDIKRYIYEEIFKKLKENASLLLQIASVYRFPVPSEAFFMEDGLDFKVLDELVESNLMQETSYDEYEAHDLIKEFFYNRLTPAQRTQYHLKASGHYMEVGTERATVEAMYHLAMGGETLKALKLASTYGESIITKGLVEQFDSVLSLLEKGMTEETKEYNAATRLLKGEVQMLMGRWDRALSELKMASAIGEAEDRPLIVARANLRLGIIESRRGSRVPAEKRLQKSLRTARKLHNKGEMAKALQALGELYSSKGEFKEAEENLKEALSLSKELKDPTLEAASYTGLGVVYTNQDRHDLSIEQFQKAISALERKENALEMARTKISLGTVLASTGDLEKAIENFEEAIELSEETGDIRQQGYGLSGAAHAYLLANDHETAEEYLEDALRIFTDLGEKYKIAMVHLDYGRLYLMKKLYNRMHESFGRCLKLLEEQRLTYYHRKVSKEVQELLRSKGMASEAKRYEG